MNPAQPNLCLYGGTFDPIHLGHTFIAQQVVKQLGIDKVIFLPCRQSPHKDSQSHFSDDERLTLCRAATEHLAWAEVSDYDLTAPSPSYSWRTIEHFKSQNPGSQLYWLMGTDQWEAFPRWARAEHIAEMLEIVVYCRDRRPIKHPGFQCQIIEGSYHPASATAVRKHIANQQVSPWLAPGLDELIKKFDHS